MAAYLASINLTKGTERAYSLKTLPRPTGRATKAIVTEYQLPRKQAQPHDAAVDPQGNVWYTDFGLPYIGMLNPRTGEVKEYELPEVKPGYPTGSVDIEIDEQGNPWVAMLGQGAMAKLDRKTGKFQYWETPYNEGDWWQGMLALPLKGSKDRRPWFIDNSRNARMLRLDLPSNHIDVFPINPDPKAVSDEYRSFYGIGVDNQGNGWGAQLGGNRLGRIDAKTGKVTFYLTPGIDPGPRRIFIDAQDRLWFAEYRGSRLGMFDIKTERFRAWPIPTTYSKPYDVVVDKNGQVWGGGMWTDRIFRFDPKTEQVTDYLLPSSTNTRRVDVDNSATPVALWTGSNHAAKLVKVEPLD